MLVVPWLHPDGGGEGFGGSGGLEVGGFRPYHSMLASCCIFGCTRSNTRISNHGENIVELFKSLDVRQRKRQTHKLQNFLISAC